MKSNVFIILIIVIIFIIKSKGQQQSSSGIDDDSKCYGETLETCITSGACCIWCGSPKDANVTKTTGVCFYQSSLTNCPSDVLTYTGDKCKEYNSASCTCSLRNTTNNGSSSSPSSLPPINYGLVFFSIVLIMSPCIFNFF
ncbi:hypothetical protein RB653_009117 [Dictyostelium firmibasis]|uniref:Uncharacterized protein n=1 Tax=Dictyostelium firmibasis TaxID=79012 RepID=A0AAN7TTR9_9MYCE